MITIKLDLPCTVDAIPKKNILNSYLPLRNKGNDFSWDVVVGLFLSSALHTEVRGYEFEAFVDDCRDAFGLKLDELEFWHVLERMYFQNNAIYRVAPECLLFGAQKENSSAADRRISGMFCSLLNGLNLSGDLPSELNFLEQEIVNVLKKRMVPGGMVSEESPYLPYLSKYFKQDIKFLVGNPKYLLDELQNLLALYSFLYCSQLALNLPEWRTGEPKSRPLFFIMDNEKASAERSKIKDSGWRSFNEASKKMFPMLSMLENLQANDGKKKEPLWRMANDLRDVSEPMLYREAIRGFCLAFKEDRKLTNELMDSDDALDWLDRLIELAIAQFDEKLANSTRHEINDKYVREIEQQIGSGFIQTRGRAGRVLVLNQDTLILLTNIAIGNSDKLRFHELLLEVEGRGVYFDKQSQQKLIEFYERIGNVERMSDSGDAVYVYKTV